jgi:recombinational DNA repair protein RecR
VEGVIMTDIRECEIYGTVSIVDTCPYCKYATRDEKTRKIVCPNMKEVKDASSISASDTSSEPDVEPEHAFQL